MSSDDICPMGPFGKHLYDWRSYMNMATGRNELRRTCAFCHERAPRAPFAQFDQEEPDGQ